MAERITSDKWADPGYRGKPHYKINTAEQVKSSWSWINMPRNSRFYNEKKLSHIKDNIKKAAKEFGIEIAEKATSTIQTADISSVNPKITPPDSTVSHFFTVGRMIT